eukprot:2422406-Amphidinium_carterae.1
MTSIQRHYNNTYNDAEKQTAVNLFLGIYDPRSHPSAAELDSDSILHHGVLQDNFAPGEWWLRASASFTENLELMRSASRELDKDASEEWFREVHKVWKMTHLEKLINSALRAEVVISPSSIEALPGDSRRISPPLELQKHRRGGYL